jgi:hypothetical protein
MQVLTVGGVAHRFTTNADELCSLVRLPAGGGGNPACARVVGDVRCKLKLARSANDGLGAAPTLPEPAKKTAVQLPPQVRPAPAPGPAPGPNKAQLRLVLITLLAARPMSWKAITGALDAIAQTVAEFTAPSDKQQRESAIKAVATYRAPGVYVLNPELKKESEGAPAGLKQPLAAAVAAVAALGAARPAPAPAVAVPTTAAAAPAAGGKRGEEGGGAAAPAVKRQKHPTPSLASAGTGSAGGSGAQPAGRRTPASAASSRGSDDGDESWVLEHVGRRPREVPPVTSAEVRRQHIVMVSRFRAAPGRARQPCAPVHPSRPLPHLGKSHTK